jgi:hypothetical protein
MSNQSTEQTLETVDVSYWADQLDALERLEKNPDFKKVIVEGFIKSKALDSVSLLAEPSVKGNRGEVMEDLVAISHLQYHLLMIQRLGAGARQDAIDSEMFPADVEDEIQEIE